MQGNDREINQPPSASISNCSKNLSASKGAKEKEKGAADANGRLLPVTEAETAYVDDLPPLIKEEDNLLEALCAYYRSQDTFRQGLSARVESIEKSYINISILTVKEQQEKEQELHKIKEQGDGQTKKKESYYSSNQHLASYEALHAVSKHIALEAIFDRVLSTEEKGSRVIQKVLVLGRAGIGKTTLSQHIAYRWATKALWPQFKYIFWLPLRNLNQPHYMILQGLTLAHIIRQECFAKEASVLTSTIDALIGSASEEILLLLDGYDEIAHLLDFETPLSRVVQQAFTFSNILVTSRPYPAPSNIPFDRRLESMGFTNDNIMAYVANYFDHPEVKQPAEAKRLQQFLKSNPNIWGTAHIPINLALVCNAWEQALVEGRTLNVRLSMTGLYSNLVQNLLKHALARRGVPVYHHNAKRLEKQCRNAIILLEALAAKGLETHQLLLAPSLQQALLVRLGQDGESFEEALMLGLLQTVGRSKSGAVARSHYFIHLTFQEYLAARYYVQGLRMATEDDRHQATLAFIREHKYSPRYQIVFWFMAGLLSANKRQRPLIIFWQALLDEPYHLIGLAHLPILMRCIDEAQCDPHIPQKDNILTYIAQVLTSILRKAGSYYLKTHTDCPLLTVLSQCPHLYRQSLVLNPLLQMAKDDKDIQVRIVALTALGNIANSSPEVVSLLCEQAVQDKDERARKVVLEALCRLVNHPSPQVIDLLCERAAQDRDSDVRGTAIKALCELKDPSPEVIHLFFKRAVQEEKRWIRSIAIEALGRLENPPPGVIHLLCKRAVQEKEGWFRSKFIEALDRLKNSSEVIYLLCERAGQDEDEEVRNKAIEALGRLKNPSPGVIHLLCERAVQDNDKDVRIKAIEALGRLENPPSEVIYLLCERVVQDNDKDVRIKAIKVLCQRKDSSPEVIHLLCERAGQDKDEGVRKEAIEALGRLENPPSEVIYLLCERAMQEEGWWARSEAIEALGRLKNPPSEVIYLLCERAVQDRDFVVRSDAVKALSQLENPSPGVIHVLCEWTVQEEDEGVRSKAIEALGRLMSHPLEVVRLLCRRAVEDKSSEVRRTAIKALGQIADRFPALLHFLGETATREEDEGVRWEAIRSLVNLANSSPEVIDLLGRLAAQDKDEWVREAAIECLLGFMPPKKGYAVSNLDRLRGPSFEVISLLHRLAAHAHDKRIRSEVNKAICRISNPPLSNPIPEVIGLICEQAMKSEDKNSRIKAIKALCRLENPSSEVIDLLGELAKQDKDNWIIILGSKWAARILNSETIYILYTALERYEKSSCYQSLFRRSLINNLTADILIQNYLELPNMRLKHALAYYLVRNVYSHQNALVVTPTHIKLYGNTLKVFDLPQKQGAELSKALIKTWRLLTKATGIPAASDLASLSFAEIEMQLVRAKEEKSTLLSLRSQGINNSQIKHVASYWQDLPFLTEVDLSANNINDEGAIYLANALVENTGITKLNLAHNKIRERGAKALIQVLGGEVKVGTSWFTFFSPSVSVAKPNRTLCSLNLDYNLNIPKDLLPVIQTLLQRNQECYERGRQLLECVKGNDIGGMKKALKAGALLAITNRKGERVLHLAARLGHIKGARYLLETERYSCVNMLNLKGMTAFYVACVYGQWGIARYFLSQGADVNAVDHQGRCALHHAAEQQNTIVMKFLLYDQDIRDKIQVNLPDHQGQTPLHYAAMAESPRCTRLLLKGGANPTLTNKQGERPLDIAYRIGEPTVISYLENAQLGQNAPSRILPPHSADNWVKIRVWPGELTKLSLGHISLETATFYASFWPDRYHWRDGLQSVSGTRVEAAEADIHLEGREPQTFTLYSLNLKKMEAEYELFSRKPRQWALKGRNKFAPDAQSCSGLVYDLLVAGGIEKLVGIDWISRHLVTTPTGIGELAEHAQLTEVEKYPTVSTYTSPSLISSRKPTVVKQEEYEEVLRKTVETMLDEKLAYKFEEQTQLRKAERKTDKLERRVELRQLEVRLQRREMQRQQQSLQPTPLLGTLQIRKIIEPWIQAAQQRLYGRRDAITEGEVIRNVARFYLRLYPEWFCRQIRQAPSSTGELGESTSELYISHGLRPQNN